MNDQDSKNVAFPNTIPQKTALKPLSHNKTPLNHLFFIISDLYL